jgi:peptide/nickel transport system permease protein
MWKYIVKRLAIFLLVIVAATALTFYILHSLPGESTASVIVKYVFIGNTEVTPTNEEISFVTDKFDLGRPLYVQYLSWLDGIVHGNMGYSYINNKNVYQVITAKFPATLQLALACTIFSVVIGVPLGILAALRQNSWIDYFCNMGTLMGKSIPNFWLALMLILVFSLGFNLTPVVGYGTIQHMILPTLTLGIPSTAIFARLTRASMVDILRQDYIRTAKGKGLMPVVIVVRHALRNALLPLITVIGLEIGHMMSGAVIIENIFAWPGIGKLLVDAIKARDIPVIQGCVLMFIVTFLVINFLVDLIYPLVDPKIGRSET